MNKAIRHLQEHPMLDRRLNELRDTLRRIAASASSIRTILDERLLPAIEAGMLAKDEASRMAALVAIRAAAFDIKDLV